MATHSSVLAWRILGTAERGGLLSMGSHRVAHAKRLSSNSSKQLITMSFAAIFLIFYVLMVL